MHIIGLGNLDDSFEIFCFWDLQKQPFLGIQQGKYSVQKSQKRHLCRSLIFNKIVALQFLVNISQQFLSQLSETPVQVFYTMTMLKKISKLLKIHAP